jgi:hypothetical protein
LLTLICFSENQRISSAAFTGSEFFALGEAHLVAL